MIAFYLYSYVNCLQVKDLKVYVPQAEDTCSSCDFCHQYLFILLRSSPYSADFKYFDKKNLKPFKTIYGCLISTLCYKILCSLPLGCIYPLYLIYPQLFKKVLYFLIVLLETQGSSIM